MRPRLVWAAMPFRGQNPLDEIEQIFDRMSREFGPEGVTGGSVAVDVEDRDGEFVVTADVPGYSKEDIDVTIADRTLKIRAERESETEETDADYLRRERRRTSASRSVRLPAAVDEEGISATYKNGVLTITLPKREGGGQRIEVE